MAAKSGVISVCAVSHARVAKRIERRAACDKRSGARALDGAGVARLRLIPA
jgi:hypothetical protein